MVRKLILITIPIILIIILCSCTIEEPKFQREEHILDRIEREYQESKASITSKLLREAELIGDHKFIEAYKTKQVYLGMLKSEVWVIKGGPTDRSTTIDYSGTHDFWIYGYFHTYYFINDVLISFDK